MTPVINCTTSGPNFQRRKASVAKTRNKKEKEKKIEKQNVMKNGKHNINLITLYQLFISNKLLNVSTHVFI